MAAIAVLALGRESSYAVIGPIIVTTTADIIDDDGLCSLREAVKVAREDIVIEDAGVARAYCFVHGSPID